MCTGDKGHQASPQYHYDKPFSASSPTAHPPHPCVDRRTTPRWSVFDTDGSVLTS